MLLPLHSVLFHLNAFALLFQRKLRKEEKKEENEEEGRGVGECKRRREGGKGGERREERRMKRSSRTALCNEKSRLTCSHDFAYSFHPQATFLLLFIKHFYLCRAIGNCLHVTV